jgi:peptidoglycan hydrolase-like protein with peptidoglycan-binding domain
MIYKLGSKGEVVKQIQRALAGAGLGVAVDGVYGHVTEEAVREFQKTRQLKVDGIVGPATMALLLACRFKKSKRRITDIVIHCTASKVSNDLTVEDIRRMHKKQGWADIGYHYVVTLDGRVHTGRDVDLIGAHVSGHNAHSIGVVYVGGLDRDGDPCDTRNDLQKAALLSLLLELRKNYPDATISGHRDFSPDLNGNGTIEPFEYIKLCPCFNAKTEYKSV